MDIMAIFDDWAKRNHADFSIIYDISTNTYKVTIFAPSHVRLGKYVSEEVTHRTLYPAMFSCFTKIVNKLSQETKREIQKNKAKKSDSKGSKEDKTESETKQKAV